MPKFISILSGFGTLVPAHKYRLLFESYNFWQMIAKSLYTFQPGESKSTILYIMRLKMLPLFVAFVSAALNLDLKTYHS
jgi:hypothetical protein